MNAPTPSRTIETAFVATATLPSLAPPASVRPTLPVRLFRTYFGTPANAAITLGCVLLLAWLLPAFLSWAFINATWSGTANDCRAAGGACWAFIREKFWFSVFGLYPFEQRWRPATVLIIFAVMVAISTQRFAWRRELVFAWLATLALMWGIMGGSV
ncbi:MAG: hypothetical protein WCH83_11650, partial [Alphaproteobacteria bacterium]